MPKMKTLSALKGRFRLTGTGKVKRNRAGRNHLLEHKSGRRKRALAAQPIMTKGDVRRLQQQLKNLK